MAKRITLHIVPSLWRSARLWIPGLVLLSIFTVSVANADSNLSGDLEDSFEALGEPLDDEELFDLYGKGAESAQLRDNGSHRLGVLLWDEGAKGKKRNNITTSPSAGQGVWQRSSYTIERR